MTFTLCLSALLKFLLGVVLVAALLFIPAGTLNYPNAILLMVILFVLYLEVLSVRKILF